MYVPLCLKTETENLDKNIKTNMYSKSLKSNISEKKLHILLLLILYKSFEKYAKILLGFPKCMSKHDQQI